MLYFIEYFGYFRPQNNTAGNKTERPTLRILWDMFPEFALQFGILITS